MSSVSMFATRDAIVDHALEHIEGAHLSLKLELQPAGMKWKLSKDN